MDQFKMSRIRHEIVELAGNYCREKLNTEVGCLIEKLIRVRFPRGAYPYRGRDNHIWAAAFIHVIASINLLYEESSHPHIRFDHLCIYFGVEEATVEEFAKTICKLYKIDYWNSEFSTRDMMACHPFTKFVLVDGEVMPIDILPDEYRAMVLKSRAEGGDVSFASIHSARN